MYTTYFSWLLLATNGNGTDAPYGNVLQRFLIQLSLWIVKSELWNKSNGKPRRCLDEAVKQSHIMLLLEVCTQCKYMQKETHFIIISSKLVKLIPVFSRNPCEHVERLAAIQMGMQVLRQSL